MINLIPMAGLGNRFFQEKYKVPKPFVPILGMPMFLAAARSFPPADKHIFICRKEHFEKYKVKQKAEKEFRNSDFVTTDKVTEGQACTCLLAKDRFEPTESLYIASCDYQTVYDRERYQELMYDSSIDIIIWTFKIGTVKKADPKSFAYCRTKGDKVIEVVEKKTISDTPHLDPAVVGSFTYKKSEHFVRGADKMIEKNIRVNNEFYVATSINQLIEEGLNVVTFEVDKYVSFGNPFELMLFQFWGEYFRQLEDHPYATNPIARTRT